MVAIVLSLIKTPISENHEKKSKYIDNNENGTSILLFFYFLVINPYIFYL